MNHERANNRLLIGAVAVIAALVSVDVACVKNPPPPATGADAARLIDCVEKKLEAGEKSVIDIASGCENAAVPAVTDVVSTLVKAQHVKGFRVAAPTDGGGLDSH